MKIASLFLVIAVFGIGVFGEVPAAAPYPARGWKPSGPAFELPTKTQEPSSQYGPADIEVTEEELQYTGEAGTTEGTTQFSEYGPPDSEYPGEATTSAVTAPEDDLSVQGLPSTEPAKDFRNIPSRLRNQRVRVQQTSARLQTNPGSQQFFQGTQFQQSRNRFDQTNTQFAGFSGSLQLAPQRMRPAPVQQFGQFKTNPQTFGVRNQRLRSQKQQEAPVDSYGAPAQEFQPANAYGPPQNEYGTPEQVGEQPGNQAEEIPPTGEEETTEPSELDNEGGEGPAIAVANSVATGRYILVQQRNPKSQQVRIIQAEAAKIRTRPNNIMMQPVYTFDQFGQLVRVL